MKLRKNTEDYVRIIIARGVVGYKGIKKPIKSISLQDTNVEEVYNKIIEILKKLT